MGVERVSSSASQSLHTRAIGRAVELALKDVRKVQSRLTEELRVEDAIRGLELHGREVHVLVDSSREFKPDGLRDLVKGLLKKHGASGVRVELHRQVSIEAAVSAAKESIAKVQRRMTTDMRPEDDIVGVSLHEGRVSVALKAHPYFKEPEIEAAVRTHLAAAGLKKAEIDFIRPAILPIRPPSIPEPIARPSTSMKDKVLEFEKHVHEVQARRTREARTEDAIASVKLVGAKVEIKFWKSSAHSEASVQTLVKKELKDRGVSLPIVFKVKDPRDV